MAKSNLIVHQSKSRTHEDLKRLQALPLVQKIELTKRRIHQWYTSFNSKVYIAFSGGKDSTVLLDIARQVFNDIPAVFSNTGLEYPEIVKFAKSFENVVEVKPKMSFKQVIDNYGWAVVSKVQSMAISRYNNTKDPLQKEYRLHGTKNGVEIGSAGVISDKHKYLLDAPFKISEKCCEQLKKKPFKEYQKKSKRVPIMGTMADESKLREQMYIQHGCNMFDNTNPISAPMSFWTEQDVLEYIVKNKTPYCEDIYGQIKPTKDFLQVDMFGGADEKQTLKCTKEQRTGCMWCMFGLELETLANHGENRFTRMKKTHPKQWNAVINKYGAREVLDFMKLPYN